MQDFLQIMYDIVSYFVTALFQINIIAGVTIGHFLLYFMVIMVLILTFHPRS